MCLKPILFPQNEGWIEKLKLQNLNDTNPFTTIAKMSHLLQSAHSATSRSTVRSENEKVRSKPKLLSKNYDLSEVLSLNTFCISKVMRKCNVVAQRSNICHLPEKLSMDNFFHKYYFISFIKRKNIYM